ncbi:MAG: hypothetical protein WC107_02865 [Patescibacteria group bacterium]
MKKILLQEKEINFSVEDLPMIIHGKEGSGASFFSIVTAANLFLNGNKILFFTAYPMAKEKIINQLQGTGEENNYYYIENVQDIEKAKDYRLIIIKSGDQQLFSSVLDIFSNDEKIIFIKNIDEILSSELFAKLDSKNLIVLSGDLNNSEIGDKVAALRFNTKILFSDCPLLGLNSLNLNKYEAMVTGNKNGKLTLID